MGGMSRRKGAAFEREIATLIRDHLGFEAKRNLMQTAEGGHDLLGVPGWAVECKRYAKLTQADINKFWEQTVRQAAQVAARPCLITKADRQPIQVHIQWLGPGADCYGDSILGVATISFELWCGIVRETTEED